jgi:hypothetical protein
MSSKYSPAHTIKAYAEKAYAEKPKKVEWKTPAQIEKALKRKSEKEAKKRAAAGEWSKEEDGPVVFEKIPWFDWAEEA